MNIRRKPAECVRGVLCAVRCVLCVVCCVLRPVLCTAFSVQSAMCSCVLCAVWSRALCAVVCCVQLCAVCRMLLLARDSCDVVVNVLSCVVVMVVW